MKYTIDNNGIHFTDCRLDSYIEDILELSFKEKQYIKAILIFSENYTLEKSQEFLYKYKGRNWLDICRNYRCTTDYFGHEFRARKSKGNIQEVINILQYCSISNNTETIETVLRHEYNEVDNLDKFIHEIISQFNYCMVEHTKGNYVKSTYENMKIKYERNT